MVIVTSLLSCRRNPLRTKLAYGATGLAAAGTRVPSWQTNQRLHVTLGITDDYLTADDGTAEALVRIGQVIEAEPVPMSLDRLSGHGEVIALRPSRRPSRLGILQRQLERRLVGAGLFRRGWRFNPHVTLIYRPGMPFSAPVPPIAWEAAELVLIHSLLGETRHQELGRWPLVHQQLGLAL